MMMTDFYPTESLRSAMASWCPVSTEFRFLYFISSAFLNKPLKVVKRVAEAREMGTHPLHGFVT